MIGALLIVIVWLTYGSQHYQGRLFLMALAHIAFSAFGVFLAWQAQPRAGNASREASPGLTTRFIVSQHCPRLPTGLMISLIKG